MSALGTSIFTLSNARRFYSSMGNPLDGKGSNILLSVLPSAWSQNVNKWYSYSLTVDSYVLLSYVLAHDDGRKSFPLCFIFISPQGLYNNNN